MLSSASSASSASSQFPAARHDSPRLLADVGGTNARFALEYGAGEIDAVQVLACADYPGLADAIEAYLSASGHPAVRHAVIAIATPVRGDRVSMVNHDWTFSIEQTRARLQLDTFLVVNDFTALAKSLPHLSSGQLQKIGGGTVRAESTVGLVGAGTGLGVGGLVSSPSGWLPLNSEGGHVTFSPADEREIAILQYGWRQHPHLSPERLVSGPGIELTYQALAAWRGGHDAPPLKTPEIVARGLDASDPLCAETLECFCAMLGTVASNVVVTLGALGGLYIGGGIVPRLGDYFGRSPFRARFESKGRFSEYLAGVPTFVITAPYPAFVGVSAILEEHMQG